MHAIEDHHADPILDSLLSREIVIDNRGNSNEHEDYQVELDIAGNHLFFSDQNSLRFIDSNLQSINYWNESFPGKLWLKMPKIPASVFSTVRLFEGHPSEESKSNGDDTFEFFDDCNGPTYDELFDFVAVEPQEKYSGNPILQQGSSGQWDDYGIRDQSLLTDQYGNVVIESGKHILYYGGYDGTDIHIGRAEFERPSVSSIQNMTKNANNPLLSPSDMSWGGGFVYSPCPIKKGASDYIMYFCAAVTGGDRAIYYATSTDGINWSPNTTPILSISGHQLTMVNVRQIQYGTNAGTIVLYVEYDAGSMYHATSSNWTSGWSWDSGNPILTTADISWASVSGPCNPKFIELAEDKYILGITANSAPTTYDRVGFMKSQSLNSDWEDYGKFVLDAGAGGAWDDTRIESSEIVKDDIGNNIVGMFYFGCPTTDSWADGAIGYTTIDQDAHQDIFDSDKWQYGSTSGGGTAKIILDGESRVLKLDKDGTTTVLNLWAKKGGSLFSIQDLAFHLKARWEAAVKNVFHMFRAGSATENGGNECYVYAIQEDNNHQLELDNRYSGAGHSMGIVTDLGVALDTYYEFEGRIYNNSSGHPYVYGTVNSKEKDATDTADKHAAAGYFGLQAYKANDDAYFDIIYICKYVSPNPTTKIGAMI